jgi:uncharacterized protein YxeA
MKKIMIAALSLSLLSGATVMFAQNTNTDTSAKKKTHKKKGKKSTSTDTMAPK